MTKYIDTQIVFREIPNEITLAINISNCQIKCKGCHSPHLQKDIGKTLTFEDLFDLVKQNKGITCVAFMGGEECFVKSLAQLVKQVLGLKTAWFTGEDAMVLATSNYLDYIKLGPYIEELGGLDNILTNQRLYEIKEVKLNGKD